MLCKCEDPRHGLDGCLIPNDGEYGDICQACYTRCYVWHNKNNIPHRCGKTIKIKECKHEKKKTKEEKSIDHTKGKKITKTYCKHCASYVNSVEESLW